MATTSVFLSWRHSIQCWKYRSRGMIGACFGIRTPPAGQTHAEFTEVLACLAATSVFVRRRQGKLMLHLPKYLPVWRLLRYSHTTGRTNQCFKYRSFSLFGGYFGIRIPPAGQTLAAFTPAGQTLAAFTEVTKILRCTSVIPSTHCYSNCLIYGSTASFSLHFRNLSNSALPPAATSTEVQQVFLSTSVISSPQLYSSCLIYGSMASFSLHFRNLINPSSTPATPFTEV